MNSVMTQAERQALPTSYPSRKQIHKEMMTFVRPRTWKGLLVFGIDYAIWIAAIVGVLFLGPLWAKILCSIVAGLKVSNLSSLGHEFAHGTLVRGAGLNKFLAVMSFMPGLFNYRLWLYDHHVLHHAKVNGKHRDAMTPFSKAEYDALPAHRRLLERMYRAPLGLGFALYEIVERWLGVKFFPRAYMPERTRAEAWPYFAVLVVYLVLFLGLLAAAPLYSPTGSVTAIVLGFLVPHYIWMELVGFTVYVQHTHPRIAWFDGSADRLRIEAPEIVSTHIEFPAWLKLLVHNVYDHAVHHVQPRIPSYEMAKAQARLNAMIGAAAVKEDFSISGFADTVRRCKLYDFENYRWLDFDGRPTSDPIDIEATRALIYGESAVPYAHSA
jgi:omega-6 fatty acid desaturase (delta-12 desaturase)